MSDPKKPRTIWSEEEADGLRSDGSYEEDYRDGFDDFDEALSDEFMFGGDIQ